MNLFSNYSFLTVLIGTIILSIACCTVGTITVLTKQSLIGDTIAHASYPGVIFSYIVFQSKNPWLLTLGALLSGYLSYYVVCFITNHSKHTKTNALALVSASFFGLGIVLKMITQGSIYNSAQAGLQRYLFGQAAFIQLEDIYLISFISILNIIIFIYYFHSFKLAIFDPIFSSVNGVPLKRLSYLTNFMIISLTAIGLKVVGAILMSSFLIAPAINGLILSKKYHHTLTISILTGIIASFIGTYLSSITSGLSTGPAIIISMSLFVFFSFIFTQFINRHIYKGDDSC